MNQSATDWLGVIIGAILSVFTTLAFNRYTDFQKTKQELAFFVLNLDQLLNEVDESLA